MTLKNHRAGLLYRKAAGQIRELCKSGAAKLQTSVKAAFLSSFTIDPLVDFAVVEAAARSIELQSYIAPYGQFNQELLNPQSELYRASPQITFLLIEAESDGH